jgi:signal transduction histidine kinase
VQHLTNVVQEVVRTNSLDARVPSEGSRDELNALVQLFNQMLGRIESLVRGMRESLDNVAHDLRTPLTRLRHKDQTAIQSVDDLSTRNDCPGCQVAIEKFADCVEEADRISQILNTLVDIAEAEARIGKIEHAATALDKVVRDGVDSYTEFAEASRVTVISRVPAGVLVSIDDTALFRVIANLIDNAIKYTPGGGSVTINAEARGSVVEMRVTDTGVGIAPEDLPRVWDRLFRSDRSRSQRGMGLGLSLVRAIVESCGGRVAAECNPEAGTTIRVTLPAANATQDLEPAGASA